MMPDQIMFEGFGQATEPVRAEGLFYCSAQNGDFCCKNFLFRA